MLLEVTFDIAGDVSYARAFTVLAHEADDLSDPFEEIGDQLIQTVGAQFGSEGGRTGHRWAPLNPAYARWKEQHWGSRPILVQTGAMRSAALDKRRALKVTSHSLIYTVHDEKAGYHQAGSGHLPQRKLVDLGIADRREWDRIIHDWVNGLRHGVLRRTGV